LFTAYEVLSDPKKKQQYDQFGESSFHQGAGDGNGNFAYSFNFDDFMQQFDSQFGDFGFKHHTQGGKKAKKNPNIFSFGDIFHVRILSLLIYFFLK